MGRSLLRMNSFFKMNNLIRALFFLELYLVVFVSSHPARPKLPLCTEEKRNTGREQEIQCIVDHDQYLDYDDIRSYSSSLADDVKINVSITCFNGGRIRLPWPFYAAKVVSLLVNGCTNEGLLSERTTSHPQVNELRQVVLQNINHRVTIVELHDSIVNMKNMSTEYNCGPTNTVVQVFKNMQYVFPQSNGSLQEILLLEEMMSMSTVEQLISSSNEVCRFPNLRYLEYSGSRSFSTFHLKLMETNQYPNLRVYSLRNNSLGILPPEIANLQLDFLPRLSFLDMSDNDLMSADFVVKGKLMHNLLINLRKNMIRQLSHELIVDIVKSNGLILDIRDNPLECSCDLYSYGEYLAGLKSSSATTIYKEVTCQHKERGTISQRLLSERDFGLALCNALP